MAALIDTKSPRAVHDPYPREDLVWTAIHGAVKYQLSWFDAHLWAYAEVYNLPVLLSEDFQHGRVYGGVRAVNPFLDEIV